MKTVNSLSGGETSSMMAMKHKADYNVFALVCLDDVRCKPKDPQIINYVNNKLGDRYIGKYGEFIATAEDDKTLYAMSDLEQLLGQEIIWVRGDSFDTIIQKRYESVLRGNKFRLPSWARRYCTTEMKIIPIFEWWLIAIGEKVKMNIGYRFDEFDRMESFFNSGNASHMKHPVSCRTYGSKMQILETFDWRKCHFPLVKELVEKRHVKDFWKKNGWLGGDLFEPLRQIKFPKISNCVGCFHKKEQTLSVQCQINPEKMRWFSEQEEKGMGTWLDSKKLYRDIQNASYQLSEELFEALYEDMACDSGGCTG